MERSVSGRISSYYLVYMEYPRYFISAEYSWGNIVYVILYENGVSECVDKNGSRMGSHPKYIIEYNVKNGYWREITKPELALIL